MAEEAQTQETTPSLESFNESDTTPAATPAEPAPAATEPTADPKPAEPTPAPADAKPQATEPAAKPAEDAYAKVTEGLIIPQGLEVEEAKLSGLKDLAKQHNLSADAVKALLQLDLNNNAADVMAEKKMLEKAHAEWEKANQAKYGDNLKNVETDCSRVLAELDKEGKFKELLALVGIERHPATLGFLKSIGDVHLEKPSVSPNATVSTSETEVELENFN